MASLLSHSALWLLGLQQHTGGGLHSTELRGITRILVFKLMMVFMAA